jgi:hypothetical protein
MDKNLLPDRLWYNLLLLMAGHLPSENPAIPAASLSPAILAELFGL